VSFWEAVRIACQALAANRLRSLLTVLGTVVGVLAVVSVISITQGLNRYVSKEVLATGSHVFSLDKVGFVTSHEDWLKAGKRRDIRLEDAWYLRDHLESAGAVVPQVHTMKDVSWGGTRAEGVWIQGLGGGYLELGDLYDLHVGRHLSEEDVGASRRVVVLGWEVADQLFGAVPATGKALRLGGETFRIVGVLKQRGKVLGQSRDNVVLIPVTAFEKLFGRRRSITILVQAASPEVYAECQEEALMLLKIRRGKKPWEEPDFGIQTSETFYELYRQATALFYVAMIVIVGLSLVVGGVVMMNIMLVAVAERTREIGIRKAVGARQRDIALQFLVEAASLSGAGGLLGVFLGAGVAVLVDAFTPLPARLEAWSVVVSLLLAITVGLISGFYPATRAARLAPVVALRYQK
jgi:putative ABC transport system permease protein